MAGRIISPLKDLFLTEHAQIGARSPRLTQYTENGAIKDLLVVYLKAAKLGDGALWRRVFYDHAHLDRFDHGRGA